VVSFMFLCLQFTEWVSFLCEFWVFGEVRKCLGITSYIRSLSLACLLGSPGAGVLDAWCSRCWCFVLGSSSYGVFRLTDLSFCSV
jgi:hypothetical protein